MKTILNRAMWLPLASVVVALALTSCGRGDGAAEILPLLTSDATGKQALVGSYDPADGKIRFSAALEKGVDAVISTNTLVDPHLELKVAGRSYTLPVSQLEISIAEHVAPGDTIGVKVVSAASSWAATPISVARPEVVSMLRENDTPTQLPLFLCEQG